MANAVANMANLVSYVHRRPLLEAWICNDQEKVFYCFHTSALGNLTRPGCKTKSSYSRPEQKLVQQARNQTTCAGKETSLPNLTKKNPQSSATSWFPLRGKVDQRSYNKNPVLTVHFSLYPTTKLTSGFYRVCIEFLEAFYHQFLFPCATIWWHRSTCRSQPYGGDRQPKQASSKLDIKNRSQVLQHIPRRSCASTTRKPAEYQCFRQVKNPLDHVFLGCFAMLGAFRIHPRNSSCGSPTEPCFYKNFFCKDGCKISTKKVNDHHCDCMQCEDEITTGWTCSTCGEGCPTYCGSSTGECSWFSCGTFGRLGSGRLNNHYCDCPDCSDETTTGWTCQTCASGCPTLGYMEPYPCVKFDCGNGCTIHPLSVNNNYCGCPGNCADETRTGWDCSTCSNGCYTECSSGPWWCANQLVSANGCSKFAVYCVMLTFLFAFPVDYCARSNCSANAICTNKLQGFTCQCKPGYTGNGYSCTANRGCTCQNGVAANEIGLAVCDIDGSEDCSACNVGFHLSDPAVSSSQSCLPTHTCVVFGTDVCRCPNCTPTVVSGSGPTLCQVVGSEDCSACNEGYEFTALPTLGNQSCRDLCASAPCQNGASCVNVIGDFSCECLTGYVGKRCQNERRSKYRNCWERFKDGNTYAAIELVHPAGKDVAVYCGADGSSSIFALETLQMEIGQTKCGVFSFSNDDMDSYGMWKDLTLRVSTTNTEGINTQVWRYVARDGTWSTSPLSYLPGLTSATDMYARPIVFPAADRVVFAAAPGRLTWLSADGAVITRNVSALWWISSSGGYGAANNMFVISDGVDSAVIESLQIARQLLGWSLTSRMTSWSQRVRLHCISTLLIRILRVRRKTLLEHSYGQLMAGSSTWTPGMGLAWRDLFVQSILPSRFV
eukprot:g1051.t1